MTACHARLSRTTVSVLGGLLAVIVLAGPSAGAPADLPPPGSPNRGLIVTGYGILLGRDPDPGGYAYWADLLDSGGAPGVFAAACAYGREGRRALVADAYETFLTDDPGTFGTARREPTAGELDFWSQYLIDTGRVDAMVAHLVGSAEFAAHYDDFLTGAYQVFFARPPEPEAAEFWNGRLTAGVSRSEVALQLFGSAEKRARDVKSGYFLMLGRQPDPAGATHWVAWLGEHHLDVYGLLANLMASPEGVRHLNDRANGGRILADRLAGS